MPHDMTYGVCTLLKFACSCGWEMMCCVVCLRKELLLSSSRLSLVFAYIFIIIFFSFCFFLRVVLRWKTQFHCFCAKNSLSLFKWTLVQRRMLFAGIGVLRNSHHMKQSHYNNYDRASRLHDSKRIVSSQLNVIRLIRRVCIGLWKHNNFIFSVFFSIYNKNNSNSKCIAAVWARVASKLGILGKRRSYDMHELNWTD